MALVESPTTVAEPVSADRSQRLIRVAIACYVGDDGGMRDALLAWLKPERQY